MMNMKTLSWKNLRTMNLFINDGVENLLDMVIDDMESNFKKNQENEEENDSEERQEYFEVGK